MTDNIYQTPESGTYKHRESFELWNPDAAGTWSLIFSPLLGSIIVYKNWLSMGDIEQAQKSRKWISISAIVSSTGMLLSFFIIWLYLPIWYFLSQKQQTLYINTKTHGDYKKRPWGRPLGIALVIWLTWYGLFYLALIARYS